MGIGLSRRGTRLVSLILFVLVVSVVWRDFFSGLVGLFGAGFVFFYYLEFRGLVGRVGECVTFQPGGFDVGFTAGVAQEYPVEVDVGCDLGLVLGAELGGFSPSGLVSGLNRLVYSVDVGLAGEYGFDFVDVDCRDRYGLFTGSASVGFSGRFHVFPRVAAVALEAFEFVEGSGGFELDEGASSRVGVGLEYAESREYVPGDSIRHVDWKASARLGRLIVKDYYRGEQGSVHVVYEADYLDRVSGDVLASRFLEAVLSFAELGWVCSISVVSGGEVVSRGVDLRPVEAVVESLRVVYRGDMRVFERLFAVLDPAPRSRLRELLGGESVAESGMGGVVDLVGDVGGGLVILSCLAGDPVPLLTVLDRARLGGVPVVVYLPCTPWRSVEELETAVEVYMHYESVTRSIEAMGVGVAVGLEEAFDMLRGFELGRVVA